MNLWRRREADLPSGIHRLLPCHFAVLGMVLVSYPFGTKDLPAWLRYAPAHRAVTSPSLIFLYPGLSSGRKVSQMRHDTV